ncbi:hypothetical protein D3C73_1204310 [compost metagenome]
MLSLREKFIGFTVGIPCRIPESIITLQTRVFAQHFRIGNFRAKTVVVTLRIITVVYCVNPLRQAIPIIGVEGIIGRMTFVGIERTIEINTDCTARFVQPPHVSQVATPVKVFTKAVIVTI